MSGSKLERINELLSAHPASDKECGEKSERLAREGDLITLSVSLAECERAYRFEVERGKLAFADTEVDLFEGDSAGKIVIPWVADENAARWLIRDDADADWRLAREDSALVVDVAPDKRAAEQLRDLIVEWDGGA